MKTFFHGTTKRAARRILREGLKADPREVLRSLRRAERKFAEPGEASVFDDSPETSEFVRQFIEREGITLTTVFNEAQEFATGPNGEFGTVLEVTLPEGWPLQGGSGPDEFQSLIPIPPRFIRVAMEE